MEGGGITGISHRGARIDHAVDALVDIHDARAALRDLGGADEGRVWVAELVVPLRPVRPPVERPARREEELEAKVDALAAAHLARPAERAHDAVGRHVRAAATAVVPPVGQIVHVEEMLRGLEVSGIADEPEAHAGFGRA